MKSSSLSSYPIGFPQNPELNQIINNQVNQPKQNFNNFCMNNYGKDKYEINNEDINEQVKEINKNIIFQKIMEILIQNKNDNNLNNNVDYTNQGQNEN